MSGYEGASYNAMRAPGYGSGTNQFQLGGEKSTSSYLGGKSMTMVWVVVLLLAAVIAIVVVVEKKKKRKSLDNYSAY